MCYNSDVLNPDDASYSVIHPRLSPSPSSRSSRESNVEESFSAIFSSLSNALIYEEHSELPENEWFSAGLNVKDLC